tara:strand:- start:1193 stop:1552 length:360 start_codon:yes stop_codon:yes gene_type:complete
MVTDIASFIEARGLGERNFKDIQSNTYKYTDCGAYINEMSDGINVGSIVEGVDEGTALSVLQYPFEIKAFWDALQAVADEAEQIWQDTHGCEDCGPENEQGYIGINSDCKTCEGEGAII